MVKRKEYSIGEVVRMSGLSARQLRSWEKESLIDVIRNQCGKISYRYYSEEQLALILEIARLLGQGFTLRVAVDLAKAERRSK